MDEQASPSVVPDIVDMLRLAIEHAGFVVVSAFVLTSTNPKHATELAGRDHHVYEVVGKPVDLDEIVRAVKEASRARPTR